MLNNTKGLYPTALTVYQLLPALTSSLSFLTDAPFGRFSPGNGSGSKLFLQNLTVDGNLAWMAMELPSVITMLYTYSRASLSQASSVPPFQHPATLLVALYVIHYANRAVISPLRSPSRSRSHLIIPLASIAFNLLNGGLNGSWLSSGIIRDDGWNSASFWAAVALWLAGFVGNIVHDEILLSLRHDAQQEKDKDGEKKPHYGIPQGYLYRFVSYPNYFCEWLEWTGFAVACSIASNWSTPLYHSPPWLFVVNEIAAMLPRALSGHQWYHSKFENYPKDRKAVIPFIL